MISNYLDSFSQILSNTIITDNNGQEIKTDPAFAKMVEKLSALKHNSGTLFLIGNGGSNALISHSSVDLINTCAIKAYPLTNSNLLTCMANDYGFENVFKKPLEFMMKPIDALIAVSSSGNSGNIVNAARFAKGMGATVITFSGFKADNKLRKTGDYNLWLDSDNYGKVEIGHSLLLHHLTDMIGGIT